MGGCRRARLGTPAAQLGLVPKRVRGAIGLALAVFVADTGGIQHAFWVVLGTLSVLRSNALSTGQNALRGLFGTAAGFVVGGVLVNLIGTNEPLLWVLLPISVLVAGFLPAAISFAAGQAAFTVLVMILFNLLAPLDGRSACASRGRRARLRGQPAGRPPVLAARGR